MLVLILSYYINTIAGKTVYVRAETMYTFESSKFGACLVRVSAGCVVVYVMLADGVFSGLLGEVHAQLLLYPCTHSATHRSEEAPAWPTPAYV